VIEELEHAKARGAKIYAEVAGLGSTSNGTYVVDADESGEAVAAAIRKGLRDAGITPADVQLIIPPSCGVPKFDKSDAAALKAAFGDSLAKAHVVPLRGGIGDCGAGAQALDLVGAAMAIHTQSIPPAVNCENPIAGLKISSRKESGPIEYAVVIGSSLGGQNCAVVLKRYQN
jgi:3-oxoacyl-[acyl-carrier-protein] synthase II